MNNISGVYWTGKNRNTYRFWSGKVKERRLLEDLVVGRRIILK